MQQMRVASTAVTSKSDINLTDINAKFVDPISCQWCADFKPLGFFLLVP